LAAANPEEAVAAAMTDWAAEEGVALQPLPGVVRPAKDYSWQVLGFHHSQSRRKQKEHKSGLK